MEFWVTERLSSADASSPCTVSKCCLSQARVPRCYCRFVAVQLITCDGPYLALAEDGFVMLFY